MPSRIGTRTFWRKRTLLVPVIGPRVYRRSSAVVAPPARVAGDAPADTNLADSGSSLAWAGTTSASVLNVPRGATRGPVSGAVVFVGVAGATRPAKARGSARQRLCRW